MADADDHDWLLARERGEDVSHVPAEVRARYQELGRMIESLPGRSPGQAWKQRVIAELDHPSARARPARARMKRWAIAGAIISAAVAVVLVLALRMYLSPELITEPIATAEIHRGNQPHRSSDVSIGDTLVLHAEADRPIELRVYGDTGEPLARCTDDGGCAVTRADARRRYTLELALRASGDVRAVLFTAASGLPPPHDLEADLAAALRVRIKARQFAVFHVQ